VHGRAFVGELRVAREKNVERPAPAEVRLQAREQASLPGGAGLAGANPLQDHEQPGVEVAFGGAGLREPVAAVSITTIGRVARCLDQGAGGYAIAAARAAKSRRAARSAR